MKKRIYNLAVVAVLSLSTAVTAQVSISTNNQDPKATLDVSALKKADVADGILIPRVSKDYAQSMHKPEVSTLVYINDVSGTGGNRTTEIDADGFYYFDGTQWKKVGGNSSSSKQSWEQIQYGTGGKYVMTQDIETTPVPKDTWLILGKDTNKMVRLPKMEATDAGRMIVVTKQGSGNLTVQDYQGKVGGEPGSVMASVSTVAANRGRTFIWDGEVWRTTNY